MSSVTQRISQIKQPTGGYIKPGQFKITKFNDGIVLADTENINPTITGTVVDYLSRFVSGSDIKDAFMISLAGAFRAEKHGVDSAGLAATYFLMNIKGLDDDSIINACKLTTFDTWARNPIAAMSSKGPKDTNPDADTINNIRIMVNRTETFWQKYGPVTKNGFQFGESGYTATVDSGDGDYLTADTMWDLKVIKGRIQSKHTLQLLMYWIMGQHSGLPEFKSIDKIGFYNPRLDQMHLINISDIPQSTIAAIEKDVICYK